MIGVTHDQCTVEGPRGTLSLAMVPEITIESTEGILTVKRQGNEKRVKALHGLYRALIANMVHGVTEGFKKQLEIVGIGYRAQLSGNELTLNVGLSHPVSLTIPEGLTVKTPKPTIVEIEGADKQAVGQFAATMRRTAPPEPYKGKGIRYAGEIIRRKAGKAATGSGAKAR